MQATPGPILQRVGHRVLGLIVQFGKDFLPLFPLPLLSIALESRATFHLRLLDMVSKGL
jgi:hypothetical protein